MKMIEATRPADDVTLRGDIGEDWQQAALDWASNLRSERTREAYLAAWRDFLAFVEKPPFAVTQSDVIAYRRHLKTKPSPATGRLVGQSTINQRLSALSSFYAFAKGRGLGATNPADGVKRESVTPYGRATWLNVREGDDKKLLDQIDTSTTQGKRDRAILAIFLNRGLRVSELVGLTVGDLFHEGPTIRATVTRKGGKVEDINLGRVASQALAAYLKTRGELREGDPVFTATERGRRAARAVGRYGEGEEKPLTARAVRYLVKTYCNRLYGPGHHFRPHSLRHTAARRLDQEGASFRAISSFMGHKSGRVTTVYLQALAGDADEAVDILSGVYG